jgi:hypothetical protein
MLKPSPWSRGDYVIEVPPQFAAHRHHFIKGFMRGYLKRHEQSLKKRRPAETRKRDETNSSTTDESADERLWKIFLMGRPDLAGTRHDDPDPDGLVWPAFLEWRDQMFSHPDIVHRRLPEETRVQHRLRTGGLK